METILIIEDKDSMAQMLKQTLELEGYEIIIAKDGAEGIKKIKESKIDLVLTDLKLPKKDGIEVLKASKEENPLIPVIVMTAFGSIETAVTAMKLGAYDFITKPLDTDHLLMLIKRSLENQRLITENILLKDKLSHQLGMPTIIGKSSKMLEVADNIQKVAQVKASVFLLGESGTGKELFARAIHYLSTRKDYPFIPINCAAIPRELLESELFGHEKGSFTGAEGRKLGKFELADKGTIFLDEIGDLDLTLQSKLLRTLQEGEIERVGGIKPIKVDVRIIAATNKNLEAAVADKSFREDLYYRLSVFPITIPPLRERKEDIPALIEHFITKYSAEMKIAKKNITPEAIDMLKNYSWKGNVRELENVIERAIILCDRDTITEEHLRLTPFVSSETALYQNILLEGTLEDAASAALRIAESMRIKKALEDTHGNKSRAAEILKVSYKTLLTKIKEYGIEN
ncbi:MAG: sigma-54-dependent Fis family transcriptional regulator [Nitrospirae bacterium]|nr:sigma-54-dependent Fis family transcriptional regulator [Nitrospirota bacterium]